VGKSALYDHKEMDEAARALGSHDTDDYIAQHCLPAKYQYR